MESMWYDKEGRPMDAMKLAEKRLSDPDYKRVAMTHIGTEVDVSTVWVGLDLSYRKGDKPLIFETLVFGGRKDQYCERYSTESEAKEGHERIVKMVMRDRKWWTRWAVTFGPRARRARAGT